MANPRGRPITKLTDQELFGAIIRMELPKRKMFLELCAAYSEVESQQFPEENEGEKVSGA